MNGKNPLLRMHKIFWVSLFLLIHSLLANNVEELFRQGNLAYQQKEYQEALQYYQQILSQGYESADLYYNIGNCYYRLNKIGQAILYYEKARRLKPNDPDIRYNLKLANLRILDKVEEPPRFFLFVWWDAFKYFFSVHQLTRVIPTLVVLLVMLLIGWLFIRKDRLRRTALYLAVLTGMLLLLLGYVYSVRIGELKIHNEAVVLAPSVTVLSAPNEDSADVFVLHEGVKVKIEEVRDKWAEISLPDGKVGWVKQEVLGII